MKSNRLFYLTLWFATLCFILGFSLSVFASQNLVPNASLSGSSVVPSGSTLTINGTLAVGSTGSISGVQSSSTLLTNFAGIAGATNLLPYFTGSNTFATLSLSSLSQTLLPLTSSSAWRAAILPSSPSTGDILYWNGTLWTTQSLGSLTTGLMKVTTATGVISTGTSGTGGDYIAPGALTDSGRGLTMSSGYILGRTTTADGAPELISIGDGLTLSSDVLSSSALINPMTTAGDLIIGGTSGIATRLAASTSGYVLTSNGAATAPSWQAASAGMTNPLTTTGDIIYSSSGTTPARLGIGSSGQVLAVSSSGLPAWSTISGSGSGTVTGPSSTTAGNVAVFGSTTGTAITDSYASAVALTAGGTDQNITLTPSGAGYVYIPVSTGRGLLMRATSSTGYVSQRWYNDQNSGSRAMEMGYSGSAYTGTVISSGTAGESGYLTTTGAYPLQLGTSNYARLIINSSGGVRLVTYGAGTLVTDSSGNITASSDARLKKIDGDFTRGLADLAKIHPKLYHWNEMSGLDREHQYAGLIAQDVQAAVPESVSANSEGILSLQDRPLIAALINATHELAAKNDKLENDQRRLLDCMIFVAFVSFYSLGALVWKHK